MLEKSARIEFLKKSHLFIGLSDTDLAAVADVLIERSFDEGGLVFTEGVAADSLALIYQGKVNLSRTVKEKPVRIATLVKGDYFGEQGLYKAKKRDATATAESGTVILLLFRKTFAGLLKTVPALRHNIEIMVSSRQLALKLNYQWLGEDELIHFLGRKHRFLLFSHSIIPAVLLPPVLTLLALAYGINSATVGLVGGFLLVADLAWWLWRILDWGNDYYIVTNQRVIWLEKVIAFYDSRTEAGLGTILSVSTETDYFGRMLDFGTVIVRTYTGLIKMKYMRHPKQVTALIEEHLSRNKESDKKADEENMREVIRAKLGITKAGSTPPLPVAPVQPTAILKPSAPGKKPSLLSGWWQNAFRMRTVDGNIITYHKHIFGFIRDASPYTLGILALIILALVWPTFFTSSVPLWMGTLIAVAIVILFGCILYEYVDWQNDIYQVTPDQIIDLNRKPFGREDRRAAALENILSTEYKRTGLFGVLFNFGTVYIMVGTEKFDFEDVSDPTSVQQDIIHRQQGSIQKKREVSITAERERMAEWLAMYHSTLNEDKREKDPPGLSNPE